MISLVTKKARFPENSNFIAANERERERERERPGNIERKRESKQTHMEKREIER